jgi:hypothetical protein
MISKRITNCSKLQRCSWHHQRGTINDITKTGRQVKKILNLIFGRLSGPTSTLIKESIYWVRTPGVDHNISSYKTACDIHLKHVFLTEFGL